MAEAYTFGIGQPNTRLVENTTGAPAAFSPSPPGITLVDKDGNRLLNSNIPPAYQLLRSGASAVGWTLSNTGGATATMVMDLNSPLGGPALKVTMPDGTGVVEISATGLGIPNFTAGRGKVVLHAYVQDSDGIAQLRGFAGPSGLSRNIDRTYRISSDIEFRANGHHIIDLHPDVAAASTVLTTDELDTVKIRPGTHSAGAFWIGGIYLPEPTADRWLVVTFDDADLSLKTRLLPAMQTRRLNFTLGLNWDDVGTNPGLFIALADVDAIYAAGNDVVSHNRANTPYPFVATPGAQPTDADRLTYCTAYRYCRQQLIARGFTRAMGYHPYVQGKYDGALNDAMRAHGVRISRPASNNKNIEPFMLDKQSIVSQRSLGSAASLATAQGWLSQARTRAQDVMLMGHVLADTASSTVTWAQSDFEALIDGALASGMRIGSVSQWAQARGLVL